VSKEPIVTDVNYRIERDSGEYVVAAFVPGKYEVLTFERHEDPVVALQLVRHEVHTNPELQRRLRA
jgi:hypothetical protein